MAKNRYKKEKYKGEFSCGHYDTILVGGYSQDYRDSAAEEQFKGLCPECLELKAMEEREKMTKELGLPDLIGSEKQVEWASKIRNKAIELAKKEKDRLDNHERFQDDKPIFEEAFIRFISNAESTYWIDNRFEEWGRIYTSIAQDIKNNIDNDVVVEEEELEIITPENYNKIDATIEVDNGTIMIRSPKDQNLIDIVKYHGFKWSGVVWKRKIDDFNGPLNDRVIEIANKLLHAGFGVATNFPKDKILKADYKKEVENWVVADGENLKIHWKRFNDKFYNDSKKIRTAKWDNGYMSVNIGAWEEVLDFAELNDFGVSAKALKNIELKKQRDESIDKEKVETLQHKKVDKLMEILESPSDVLDDLKDD